tara:strand:- start:465 stop:1535 length:1071 start_codon:yes stop_codon:yes gene_type:complete
MSTEKIRSFAGFGKAGLKDKQKKLEQQDEDILERCQKGEKVLLPGQGGTELEEPMISFDATNVETIMPNKPTRWGRHRIVFGRDRHTREGIDGYGGRGATAAGSIDIVVGSGGPEPEHKSIAGPNFFTDAARIYLSQRTDIDRYFDLPPDPDNGILQSENRSGIGIKADAVRIIGREGVRIYTNARTKTSGRKPETNSVGGDIQSRNGIHLIANMDVGKVNIKSLSGPISVGKGRSKAKFNKVQPLVKGDFLVAYLKELHEDITNLRDAVSKFMTRQIAFNASVMQHTHLVASPAPGVATPDVTNLIPNGMQTLVTEFDSVVRNELASAQLNLQTTLNFLSPGSSVYILSEYNKTN